MYAIRSYYGKPDGSELPKLHNKLLLEFGWKDAFVFSASANITCLDCHLADETDPDISETHYKQYQRDDTPWGRAEYRVPIAEVVTPKDCSRCHPDEVKEFNRSKHANTLEIVWKIA